jgi:single-strand DNA-binding protein
VSQSLNLIVLVGRLTADPQVTSVGQNGTSKCRFMMAVNNDRAPKNEDGSSQADFINMESWGKQAELMGNTLRKGSLIAVNGSMHIQSYDSDKFYDQDGKPAKMYYTTVTVDNFSYMDKKQQGEEQTAPQGEADNRAPVQNQAAPAQRAGNPAPRQSAVGNNCASGNASGGKPPVKGAASALGWGGGSNTSRRVAAGSR